MNGGDYYNKRLFFLQWTALITMNGGDYYNKRLIFLQ